MTYTLKSQGCQFNIRKSTVNSDIKDACAHLANELDYPSGCHNVSEQFLKTPVFGKRTAEDLHREHQAFA